MIQLNKQRNLLIHLTYFLSSSSYPYWCFRPCFWLMQNRTDMHTLSNIFTGQWWVTSTKSPGTTITDITMRTMSLIPIMPFRTGSRTTIQAIITVKRSIGTVRYAVWMEINLLCFRRILLVFTYVSRAGRIRITYLRTRNRDAMLRGRKSWQMYRGERRTDWLCE